ncbi:MAG: sugar transferase [Anaerolineae bacterium]|nr:sugar transferase [Anaerolineae bacterium]
MNLLVIQRTGIKPYKPYYQTTKRMLDLAICGLLSPFLTPVAFIIAILIRLDSFGPAFFIQERVGKDGRLFKVYKFRTMHHNIDRDSHRSFMKAFVNGQIKADSNDDDKPIFKPAQGAHITRVGRFLRRTSLDELPQLWNVIKGEMSLVGPRPNVTWEVEEYQGWHNERLELLPGITGLAQVKGRSAILFDEIVQYDIEYFERRSMKLDLQIMWWTFASVVLGKGAR